MSDILWILLLTLTPGLELRASIPYGILIAKLPWLTVALLAVLFNIILGPVIYFFFHYGIQIVRRVAWIDKLYLRFVIRAQRKIHAAIERWGELGVALFIGVPLPGSGVYTGALGSYVLGLGFKKFFIATIIGVCIAAFFVTLATLSGAELFYKVIS